ncbi:MAG: type II secretion system major pseudopilin GspG [Moraxella sp.]|nr:type II secretion system major pseudopilin GspG [Moraxella sp.]
MTKQCTTEQDTLPQNQTPAQTVDGACANFAKNSHKSVNKQAGFTLIEVMVVIVILAVLAGLVVPRVVGQSDKARIKTTEAALATVSNALDMYRMDNGSYPTAAQGLDALSNPPNPKTAPAGGYIKGGYPKDGWGNDLQYISPGANGKPYDLYSLGGDGRQGGEAQDADIYAVL